MRKTIHNDGAGYSAGYSETPKTNRMNEEESLLSFLIWLDDNKYINGYDFDYERTIKKYLKSQQ